MHKVEYLAGSHRIYAVITGDLVNSRAMSPASSYQEMDELSGLSETVAALLPDTIVGSMDIFQHDSFQLLLQKPEHVATVAAFLHTGIAARKRSGPMNPVRMSIGLGKADLIDLDRISRSRGHVFTMSGTGVRKMGKEQLLMLNADKNDPTMSILMNSTIMLIDMLAGVNSSFIAYLHDLLRAWLIGTDPCPGDVRCGSYHMWLQLKESLEFFTRFSKDAFHREEEGEGK